MRVRFPWSLSKRRRRGESNGHHHQLVPVETGTFTYDPLDPQKDEIRLLRITPKGSLCPAHVEIFHANLSDEPHYKALSYTLGNPNDPHYTIHVNQRPFRVRENLWLALMHFQKLNDPMTIWIDALCINQNDDDELNRQVSIMKWI